MLQFARGIMAQAPRKNLHIIRDYAKLQLIDFMANITIQHITPIHFYESVQLLRTVPYSFRFSEHSVTIEFDRTFALDFTRLEHLEAFLRELENSSVPVDLDEFIKTYRRQPNQQIFKRRY